MQNIFTNKDVTCEVNCRPQTEHTNSPVCDFMCALSLYFVTYERPQTLHTQGRFPEIRHDY